MVYKAYGKSGYITTGTWTVTGATDRLNTKSVPNVIQQCYKGPYHNKHGQYLNKLGMVAQLQTKMLGWQTFQQGKQVMYDYLKTDTDKNYKNDQIFNLHLDLIHICRGMSCST